VRKERTQPYRERCVSNFRRGSSREVRWDVSLHGADNLQISTRESPRPWTLFRLQTVTSFVLVTTMATESVSAIALSGATSVLKRSDESQRSYVTLCMWAARRSTTDSEAALSGIPGSAFKPARQRQATMLRATICSQLCVGNVGRGDSIASRPSSARLFAPVCTSRLAHNGKGRLRRSHQHPDK
jgi:hypothetical protein